MSIKFRKTVYIMLPVLVVLFVIAFALSNGIIRAKNSDECFACHEDKDLTGLAGVIARVMPARERVAVLLELLGRQTAVEIPAGSVIKQAEARAELL